MSKFELYIFPLLILMFISCTERKSKFSSVAFDAGLTYNLYEPKASDLIIDRSTYSDKLHGFWLGQSLANWTGLITEMDKIGDIGDIKTGPFYTRENWEGPDEPSIWGEGKPSDLSSTINFIFAESDSIWGSDDDTDIEYMYQHLLYSNKASILNGNQIRDGWLQHIKKEEENFLWVSNQKAFDLMQQGLVPPQTGDPINNAEYAMIDAQLTTEIFGLFAPLRPDIALKMANLPIQTTARLDAQYTAEFYVVLYSLAAKINPQQAIASQLNDIMSAARTYLPEDSYTSKMYDFVLEQYQKGIKWEETRDLLYQRYQVEGQDGYDITGKNLYCNGCFASGINFGASLISLMYGEGDLKETIKIGALCGWDSDNPSATWGGMLGFILGKKGIEREFGHKFSERFDIHRTRINFPNDGKDNFNNMAKIGIFIIDRVVQDEMKGGIDLKKNLWYINQQAEQTSIKQE